MSQSQDTSASLDRKYACDWVRKGAPGVERYTGCRTVWAPDADAAITRAKREVARDGMFAPAEIEITKVTFSV